MEKKAENKEAAIKPENKEAAIKPENRFQEGIDNFKKSGIDTFLLTCESGEQCLIREPKTKEFAKVAHLMFGYGESEPDLGKAGGQIIEMCWINGDKDIKDNDDLRAEAGLAIMQILDFKIADVKKN